MTDLEKVLGKTGARKFWDNVWRNVKILTGDVAYNTKGDLQTQINAVADTASTAKTTADAAKTAAEDAKVAAGEIVTDTTDKFDSTKDYAVGDYVIYDNKAWKFTTVHPAGAWDESHVEQTNILAEIAAQNKNFAELNENFGGLVFGQDESGAWGYKVGGADPVIPFGGSLKPLVLKASQSYTADQSGYVLAFGAAANGNGSNFCSVTIKKNGNAVTPKFATANSLKLGAAWIPVDKGDVISIIPKGVNSNYQASMICFI